MPKANTYFYTSFGEYSDYGIGKHYKVLRDFEFIEEVSNWLLLESSPPAQEAIETSKDENGNIIEFRFQRDWFSNNESNYFKFLEDSGFIKEIIFDEYHTGSYGDFILK